MKFPNYHVTEVIWFVMILLPYFKLSEFIPKVIFGYNLEIFFLFVNARAPTHTHCQSYCLWPHIPGIISSQEFFCFSRPLVALCKFLFEEASVSLCGITKPFYRVCLESFFSPMNVRIRTVRSWGSYLFSGWAFLSFPFSCLGVSASSFGLIWF